MLFAASITNKVSGSVILIVVIMKKTHIRLFPPRMSTLILLCSLFVSMSVQAFNFQEDDFREANDVESLSAMFSEGTADFSFELMQSDVKEESAGSVIGAQATTVRSRLRFESAQYQLFSFYLELDDLTAIPDDSSYFSGANGETDDALIPAEDATYVRNAWLGYDIANTFIRYGRQDIDLDNGRFIGTDFSQARDASFSALTLKNESLNLVRLRLGRIYQHESPLGREVPGGRLGMDTRYFHFSYRGIIHSLLSLYHYDTDVNGHAGADTTTSGVRFSGHIKNEPAIEYAIEYATQTDAHDNPQDYSARYYLLEAGITYRHIRLFGGRESLGSDDVAFFVTPLANQHRFQGGADVFSVNGLGNISGGIVDDYISLGLVLDDEARVIVTHHRFESEDASTGPGRLGKELNIAATYRWSDIDFRVEYADYVADRYGRDIEKWWTSVTLNF